MSIQEIVQSDKLLTTQETAKRLRMRPNTLEIWRTKGKGPEFIKIDPRSLRSPIRYREADIEAWLEARICTNTSQYPKSEERSTPAVKDRGEQQ